MALAALIVRIGGDITGLNKALTQADKDAVRFGKKLEKLGGSLTQNLTVPIVGAGLALAASAIHVGEFADRLLDLVDMTGLSSTALQEFRHVALVAGVETDTLADAAIKLTTKLQSGGEQTKQMTDALSRLGLKATNAITGGLRPMDQLLPDIIGKLQGMTDITARNTIAADIFGKSWAELAPVMSLGAGAMEQARKEAHSLGLVMSEAALKAANDFRIKLDNLKASAGAITREIGMAVLPVMEKLVDLLQKDVVPVVRSVVKWFDDLSPSVKITIAVVGGLIAAIGPLVALLGTIMTFAPLIGVGFAALTGPIGLVVIAVGALSAAGFLLWQNWEEVKLGFLNLWLEMKQAVFTGARKILDALIPLTMFIPVFGAKVQEASIAFDKLATGSLTDTAGKITTLAMKMALAATATDKTAIAVTKLAAALDELPDVAMPKFGMAKIGTNTDLTQIPRFRSNVKPIEVPDMSQSIGSKLGGVVKNSIGGQAGQMIQAAASGLGPFAVLIPVINGALERLGPVLELLIQPLVEIGQVIGEALAPVLKMLAPAVKLVADIFISQLAPILKVMTFAFSFLMEGLGFLVKGIGKLIDALPFVSAKGVIETGQAMIDAARAARENAKATGGATDAVNSFAGALSNIPRVLNIALLRHNLGGTGGGGGIGGGGIGGGKGGVIITGNVYISVPGAGDPTAVANAVGRAVEGIKRRGGQSRLTVAVTPA